MTDPAAERIVITYNLTADDYARYAAAVERRSRSWTTFNISLAACFCAIPVALWFRWLAAQSLDDPEAVEMAGHFSLYAFALGVIATIVSGYIIQHVDRKRYYKATVSPREPRIAVIDRSGVTVSVNGSEWKAQWAALQRCTRERDLLLIWFGLSSAVPIPCQSFESREACDKAFTFIRARLAEARAAQASPPPLPADSPA
jgi:hypothetical protein